MPASPALVLLWEGTNVALLGYRHHMKAVRLTSPGRPLEAVDIEFPELGEHGVLVRTKAAGICHSDAHYRSGRPAVEHLPITLGHEVAGVVERVGSAVSDTSVGDRVCLHYLVTCGACEHCRSGHEQFCPVVNCALDETQYARLCIC